MHTKSELEAKILPMIKELAPAGTKFVWNKSARTFGYCRIRRNRITKEIIGITVELSWTLASRNNWSEIERTLLHEIAHANTPGPGHDKVWKRECIRLGGDGQRCFKSVDHGGDVTVPYKWVGTCPKCGAQFYRIKRCNRSAYHCDKNKIITWKPYEALKTA